MSKNYFTFMPLILPIIVIVGIYIFNNHYKNIAEEQKDYESKVQPICEKVIRKFDKDLNGIIESDEGIDLAKRVGYKKILPIDGLIFKLRPGSVDERIVNLEITSPPSKVRTGSWLGLESGDKDYSVPTFREEYPFPLTTLERIANENN